MSNTIGKFSRPQDICEVRNFIAHKRKRSFKVSNIHEPFQAEFIEKAHHNLSRSVSVFLQFL